MDFVGGAFKAAWDSATDAGRAAASAIGTGLRKVGDAAYRAGAKIVDSAIDVAKWTADRAAEVADWATEKAREAIELAKKAVEKVKEAFEKIEELFKEGIRSVGAFLLCLLKPRPLTPEEEARARELLRRLSAEEAKVLSELAYDGEVGQETADGNWRIIDVIDDKLTGYRAIVVESTLPGDSRKVLAFAGTDPSSVSDIITDGIQHFGGIPPSYRQAVLDAARLQDQYGDDLIITGHSLGGGQGNFASEMLGIPAVTINSAPLGIGTQTAIAVHGSSTAGSNSLTLATGNDLVSVIGTAGSPAHPGLVVSVESSATGGNPLSDHSLGNFDPANLDLDGYNGPAIPTPPISPPIIPGDSGPNFPNFD